jgi:RNA polymerase sigma-70 factor (ECF subfamily)
MRLMAGPPVSELRPRPGGRSRTATSPLLSEIPELYHRIAHLHRESLAITVRGLDNAAATSDWDWSGLRSRCFREAARLLPRADAEEAVQEALVRAWLRRDACRSPDAPLPWVLEITRNEARRLMGREARRGHRELVDPLAEHPDRDHDDFAGATTRMSVEHALGRLGDRDQRMLRLRYAEDLSQGEVARRLGVPEGTVKVRLHRARRRLRRLLEDEV